VIGLTDPSRLAPIKSERRVYDRSSHQRQSSDVARLDTDSPLQGEGTHQVREQAKRDLVVASPGRAPELNRPSRGLSFSPVNLCPSYRGRDSHLIPMPAVFDRALSGKDVSMHIQFHSDNNRTLLVPMRISAGRIELWIPVTVRSGSGGRGGWRRSRSPQPSASCGARSFPVGTLGRPAGERTSALGSPLRGPGPQASMIGPHLDFPRPGEWRGCASTKGSTPSPPASGGRPTPVANRPGSWRIRDWAERRIDAPGALLTRVRVPSWRVEPTPAHRALVGVTPWLDQYEGSGRRPREADRATICDGGPPAVITGQGRSGSSRDRKLRPLYGCRSAAIEQLVGRRRAPPTIAVSRSRMAT
jgi:hypothetical protein